MFGKCSRDRDFSGRNVKEFIGSLSEHDRLEEYQLSELTVAANALKLEVVNNNYEKTTLLKLQTLNVN